ncbi:MAG: putative Transcriptional regulator, Crp/Fnr family [Dehalococcoidales bacterium]|nr:putative Transcriptional regulator, Crp/Fnr family [Dehalococcoidales bacterium]
MLASADFLKRLPYFATLNPQAVAQLARETQELSLDKGEIIFLEEEPCRGLYLVSSGQIRIFKSSPEGREQVLHIAKPGDTFNDVPVFDGGSNPASAAALEPSVVYLIPKKILLSLVADCPVAVAIIKQLSAQMRRLTQMVEDLSFHSVVSRVARMLLDLATVEGSPSPVPRLTQDEMAGMVGSVRDVVGRALKSLEKAGAIKMEGHRLLVIDAGRLKEMSYLSDKSRIR